MTQLQHAYTRVGKKVQVPLPQPNAPWSAPTLSDLLARIDAALGSRAS
jgi:hypothetical protein